MENQAQYFEYINWLMGLNTLPVAGFAIFCFIWVGIVRTSAKKTVFAASGGMLAMFTMLRLLVIALPTNLVLLVIIGVIQGIMMLIMFGVFVIVTNVVRRRNHEAEAAEQCRSDACKTPQVKQWNSIETELLSFGRDAGWIK